MAEVLGYLNDGATHGEKRVFQALQRSLPQDFSVYVECPLPHDGLERMPDFIVLTTFGIAVLEVKDWVEIVSADRFGCTIRNRKGQERRMKSPIRQVKGYAHILAQMLEGTAQLLDRGEHLKVPWGCAVVMANLRPAFISRLQNVWGERMVLGLADLQHHTATRSLKGLMPYDYDLRRADLDAIRRVVNPVVSFDQEIADGTARHGVLDEVQETLVTEDPKIDKREPAGSRKTSEPAAEQGAMFAGPELPEDGGTQPTDDRNLGQAVPGESEAPPAVDAAISNASIRLVRGIAGSGKTLVLVQRARYLAAQHPRWEIGVVTFNDALREMLQANLKGVPNVSVSTFHSICTQMLKQSRRWRTPSGPQGWIKNQAGDCPAVKELGAEFVADEITWIKEVEIQSRDAYLDVVRRGRGTEHRLHRGGDVRNGIYDVLEAYDSWLEEQDAFDWADVPRLVRLGIDNGSITPPHLDALLVDEAQDFAPSWVKLLRRLLPPDGGLIFMADDPSQSIYRYYSWREKGIPVVGRTRWLRIPYRNTRQIYAAAYEVIREDDLLKAELTEQMGVSLTPDMDNEHLRNGRRPLIRGFQSQEDEIAYIRQEIEWLRQNGVDAREMVVLHRRNRGVRRLQQALRGTGVDVNTFHKLKGLEYEAVFLAGMEDTFPHGKDALPRAISEERRLVYMAMTRARERLTMTYVRRWPAQISGVHALADKVT